MGHGLRTLEQKDGFDNGMKFDSGRNFDCGMKFDCGTKFDTKIKSLTTTDTDRVKTRMTSHEIDDPSFMQLTNQMCVTSLSSIKPKLRLHCFKTIISSFLIIIVIIKSHS